MNATLETRGTLAAIALIVIGAVAVAPRAWAQGEPIIEEPVRFDTSGPLSALPRTIVQERDLELRVIPIDLAPTRVGGRAPLNADPVVQSRPFTSRAAVSRVAVFAGLGSGFSGPQGEFTVRSVPPDVSAAVGRTQYVQAVNASFAVFDKQTRQPVFGPATVKSLFTGFGGPCEQENDGDPIVEYDRMADRWIITQFQVTQGNSQCIAVSLTPDATGRYHRYEYKYTKMNDYPKVGVWPDAYYITYNMFKPASGARACAFEREKMLQGQVARSVCFQLSTAFWSLLPADLEGAALPPPGTPNPMLSLGASSQSLDLWKFHVDWSNPASSTFGVGAQHTPNRSIAVAPFNDACSGGTCIPQKSLAQQLDSLGERLMQQASYRRFATHDALVVNHSVAVASGGASAGIRWYEIRDISGTPVVFQQGTYAPDATSRWMGSVAMDAQGNLLAGYSASSSTLFPSIRVSGRTPADPAGTLSNETVLIEGRGSQNQHSRWGDYSPMDVDPVDDCTFWYTTEYLNESGVFNWRTHVGLFRFGDCGDGGGDEDDVTPATDRILYTATKSGNRDIYAVDIPSGEVTRLTTHAAADYSPSPSPDGTRIAFLSERDGTPEIYVMNADGSDQRRVTTNTVKEEELAWMPRKQSP